MCVLQLQNQYTATRGSGVLHAGTGEPCPVRSTESTVQGSSDVSVKLTEPLEPSRVVLCGSRATGLRPPDQSFEINVCKANFTLLSSFMLSSIQQQM